MTTVTSPLRPAAVPPSVPRVEWVEEHRRDGDRLEQSVHDSSIGVEIDLRDAALDTEGATLDVTATMGGVEVKLPVGWVVDVESRGSLGGVDTRLTESADHPAGAPTLRVTTNAWLGGVEISE